MRQIVKTLFFTSLYSYFGFLLMDYLRPGFVSYVFSVHWHIPVILGAGVWWSFYDEEGDGRSKWHQYIIQSIIGMMLFMLTIRELDILGDLQLIVAVLMFICPFIVVRYLDD